MAAHLSGSFTKAERLGDSKQSLHLVLYFRSAAWPPDGPVASALLHTINVFPERDEILTNNFESVPTLQDYMQLTHPIHDWPLQVPTTGISKRGILPLYCTPPEMSVSAKTSKPKTPAKQPDVKEVALETFQSMDVDKSGKVSFAEFKKAMEKKGGQKLSMTALRAFFDSFDKDKDGELSLEEIENLVL
ncbi:immunogenic protein [Echinococcus multilocularis]|uniref:Immunogenic protein n=1 Tax=Echinococcus multilocularis TaxID=6211 RepID=A0A068Y5I2_ECHMU|nr:immunogenic protein [Echinococcus multilocularis]